MANTTSATATPVKRRRGRQPRSASSITSQTATPLAAEIYGGVRARTTANDGDVEGSAILTTLAALRPLTDDARMRVLNYVGQRYSVGTGTSVGNIAPVAERSVAANA